MAYNINNYGYDTCRTIYLSPHLDDVALSCGGQIAQQTAVGQHILIVTIMAGDPAAVGFSDYAQELHGRWQLAHDAVAARRAEDANACAILRAAYQHWHIPDCIYRVGADGRPLYTNWGEITGAIQLAEEVLVEKLAAQFATLPPSPQVCAPLAVGNHVDHQIVRRAAELCFGGDLMYYEDYPYAREPEAVTAVLSPDSSAWHSQTIPLTAADIAIKIEAIAAYTSQLSTFFNGRADLAQQMQHHANIVGGERIWQHRPNPVGA
ncbi:MAG: PIG-L family deacetylase [Chloroflexi bacterium]|nr:PIG-L family deacetylase [Ardenticatenaceae bacterium]MBL1127545.1 PIG-L family deacetylase [Chloroflexota bacterium]NOG33610.1 PIG-L family deacetylase [Chloroflexota bacterium]GIK56567.1 MAG: GlcNAc-PI de-N-acetylase [Chloroflexota bacterium]